MAERGVLAVLATVEVGQRGAGARGLRAIMEEVLLPVMYDIPSRDDVAKVVVTKETVQDNVLPTIVPRKTSRAERRDKTA